ncbi:histidine kinase [Pseudocercospora fijiensis CIRAD86]|uniref:Histidine kinase n=1 Tax=Pseudocercospora fijiensis (strain CIRAD86) TaxID=383855 RepID=N1Q6H7_PSEFD|nr:histidine kinase [Pseudocercospora fijiensis CIRAD86]EME87990.1 histidine kinase [Pseudocercospora fijiensis CIRAD86]
MAQGYFDTGAFRDDSFTFECRLKKWPAKKASSPLESPRPLEPSPSWVLVSAYRESDHEQHTMCWLIDITAHKNAEEFLRKRMYEAVEMRQQKERFIDLISHEIRNPLSAMTHCIDDIIETAKQEAIGPTDDVLEAAQTISYCTQHIKNIVGDVLTLSKLDSRLVDICPQPTQPKLLVQEALRMFTRELRASAIDLELDIDPSLAELEVDWLMMDPGRFLQVLINLTTNAIKVVKDRSKRLITVKMSATHGPACKASDEVQCVLPRQARKPVDFPEPYDLAKSLYLVCSVEDTGPGLEKHELASLFERFAQENPKTESRYGGSGLGLFISRDLTELQGGRIGVASQPGVGSKFVFSIEVKRATEPPAAVLPVQEPLRGQGIIRKDSLKNKDKAAPRKLLIVEDNSINAKVLSNQLRKRGYDVSVAINGEEALEKLKMTTPPSRPSPTISPAQSDFDVVLMDIEMPVMDGITCTQQIRAFEANQGAHHRLPIIAVTANVRSEHGSAALEAGMDAITTKPYKIEDLVKQVEQFVS